MHGTKGNGPDWPLLIEEAITREGKIGAFYSYFHDYSFLNRMLLRMQGVEEPVAPYKTWPKVKRHVKAGAKAYEILHPVMIQIENEEGETEPRVVGFRYARSVFTLSQTEGKDLPPKPILGWSLETALEKLGIREVPFEHTDGNTQGYSRGLEFAISPIAANRHKTTFHELGHIVLGHTLRHHFEEYQTHRGVMEFQAESVALLSMRELDLLDDETAAHGRGYVQHWLRGERPPDKAIQQVFTVVDRILRAGQLVTAQS
jgi:hypothetical protein